MKKTILGLLLILSISSCTNENRYELVMSSTDYNTTTMLVDKKTGTVWLKFDDDTWINYGTPPIEASKPGSGFSVFIVSEASK